MSLYSHLCKLIFLLRHFCCCLLCVSATCFRITDITREAQIGRGTFYIHYVDKHDLLDKIKDLVDKELFSVSRISTDELPDDYAHEIVLQSLLNVIYYWLQKKDPETPAEVSRIILKSRLLAPYQLLTSK